MLFRSDAARDLVTHADTPQDIDEASFFADPFAKLFNLFDFMQMVEQMQEHLPTIIVLPIDEQHYFW